ncbi:MAG: sulfite exporter TauE/SafE family protein [Acidimicrobiia bacterium]|nr:sulfite exporter TauE/SafE family protein [Acidimicrobiia bacterium]
MELSLGELVAAMAAALAGGLVQGSVGFGLNLVAVPVVALVAPDALPTALILLALPMTVLMARRERHALDRRGFVWITMGRLPGTVLGAWIVAVVSGDALLGLVGAVVVVAVVMSMTSPPVAVTRPTALIAGLASGVMGTATAIGGPPLALLYQHRDGPTLRSTLASAFLVGIAMSLTALALAGEVDRDQVGLALALAPAMLAGLWASRLTTRWLDARWLRPAVLGFAAVTGVVAILRAVA